VASWNGDKYVCTKKQRGQYVHSRNKVWGQRQIALSEPPLIHGGTGKMDLDHSSGDGVHNTTA
jgi:hypothetical protein